MSEQIDIDKKLFDIYIKYPSSVVDEHNDSVFATLNFKNNIRAQDGDTYAICATMLETGQNDCQNKRMGDPEELQKATLFDD